jgi:two-component system, NtrC family, response regulator AtoC
MRRASSNQGWELVVVDQGAQRSFTLTGEAPALIGRTPDCAVRLDDPSVSRRHARLDLAQLQLEDLESRNGTWLLSAAVSGELDLQTSHSEPPGQRLRPGTPAAFAARQLFRFGKVLGFVRAQSVPPIQTIPAPAMDDSTDQAVVVDPEMQRAYHVAERAAQSTLPVLIMGETGVGKDVLAAHIHAASPRRAEPFIRVNCGALSTSLLESELFGHQRGAFTGAAEAKAGLLELGHRGTLFLDEIGELPLATQVKLLHVLETGEVTRLGETRARRIDVRFIAATNRNLSQDVKTGAFRKDLYFRVNAFAIVLAPLRHRTQDIEPLTRHFLRRFCERNLLSTPEVALETLEQLVSHPWPGNVRELKNAIERAVVLCGNGPLLPRHLPDNADPDADSQPLHAFREAEMPTLVSHSSRTGGAIDQMAANGYAQIQHALAACGGNQTRAAELLNVSRRTLISRLERYQLPRPRKGGRGGTE